MTTRARIPTRLFNVDEYYAMADAGILVEGEHVELIEGRLYNKYEGKPRLFIIEEYYAMAEAGILAPDERVELIDGEIIPMSPMKSGHAASVDSLNHGLTSQLGHRAHVRAQCPVRLDSNTEPEPDIAILKWRDDFYAHAHPRPGRHPSDNRSFGHYPQPGPGHEAAHVRSFRNTGNLDSEYQGPPSGSLCPAVQWRVPALACGRHR